MFRSKFESQLRLFLFQMHVGILLAVIGLILSSTTVSGMSNDEWEFHHAQLTYCQLKVGKRVYRQERLEDYCTIKVRLFKEQVSLTKRFNLVDGLSN